MSGAGDKILLFGSFTEDETKLFQGQPLKSPTKSVDKTWELPEIQFGSLNLSVLSLQKASNPIDKDVVLPAKSIGVQNRAITNTKDAACSNKKETVKSSLSNGGPLLANGSPTANVSPNNGIFENVKKTGAVVPSGVPVKNISSSAPHTASEVHKDGIKCTQSSNLDKEISENGRPVVDTPIVAAPADEAATSFNKKASQNMPLLPHGLKNTGNICFLNATLQALLSCSPFVHLLQDLRNRSIPKVGYPTLSAFVEFISQFDVLDESIMKKNEKASIVAAKPLNPAMFDTVLRNFTPDVPAGTSARPRQEDAQEFLSFAMDRMHDELLKLNGNGSNSKEGMVVSSADDDAWETVGRKNKSAIVRTQSFVPSELSAIFGGQLQSVVKAAGNKPSATVQPFMLLHLDIFSDVVQTLADALHLFSTPESLEGYRTAAGKAGLVTARKSFKIHSLSKIMILHLKRFSYGNHGSTKLYKPLHFPLQLVLSRDLLSSPASEGRRYELVSTITHHGRDPYRGHYTAAAKHASGQWLRFDDDSVAPVGVNEVLHDPAYVLFYQQV
ncbi:ubiquitin carboxyl-terminal hydrolase 24-like [Phragmites australis]|uniref:ubiquitin carboxyl-terminal hydrolase 24-like n=1 Tax=Phragmites australis TaxID=29695 RepID=UPI002D7A12A8|nr:ubiquitin carboxyl-terminal hydrolase 24-like [Phragmites australis]